MTTLSLLEQCEQIWEATEARDLEARRREEAQPMLFVLDGHQRLQHILLDVVDLQVEDLENDTGQIQLTLPFDHPVAQWMHDDRGRMRRGEGELFHLDVEHNGARITGRYESVTASRDSKGQRLLHVLLLTDYENLKWIDCWSNPFLPAAFQFPRVFLLAGPAIWVLKTTLFLNLLRIYSSLWQIPDDPMNPMTWLDGLDMSTWDIVIKPTTLLQDLAAGTVFALVVSRWQKWHDVAQPIMQDAELSVVTRRHRQGDPPPWPGANVKVGALVVDIVDKSGHREGAANGGTIFDGLTRTIRESVGDMIEDVETEIVGAPSWPSGMWDDVFSTPKGFPTVHFPADAPVPVEVMKTPSKGTFINLGGQSAPGVNEAISAGVQALGDLVTSNINIGGYGIGPQGGAIDALLAPFYTDVVLAWMSAKLIHRIPQSGSSRYQEFHLDLPGKSYTLSSLMALRQGVRETSRKKRVHADFTVGPYLIGPPGYGHAEKGDRVSFEIPEDLSGDQHVQRISKTGFEWGAGKTPRWTAELGELQDTDPIETIIKKINKAASAASTLGVW